MLTRLLALIATFAPLAPRGVDVEPPLYNVLFLVVDDMNCDLGCYGHPIVRSPNIDRLAAEGVRFERAYCQYPLCNPSRSSFLTGLRPDVNGVDRDEENNTEHFRSTVPDAVTLPQFFRRAGAEAARVGKLFHYGVPREIGTPGALADPPSWDRMEFPAGRDKAIEGRIINYVPGRSLGWSLGWFADEEHAAPHTDELVADRTIALLEGLRDRPFFLAAGFYRPHVPCVAPAPYFEPYPLDRIALPEVPEARVARTPEAAFDPRLRFPEVVDEDKRRFKRAYYASIGLIDAQVGRVLDAVDRLGLADSTIVVFFSDHGFLLGEHGQWEKRCLFEASVRVPLIIRAPGRLGNGRPCPRIVELVDLYPTLAELCGLDPPGGLGGASLVTSLDDPDAPRDRPAYSQVARGDRRGRSVRDGRHRYTEWDDGTRGVELYDYEADPRESRNLAGADRLAGVERRLRVLLRRAP